MIENDDIPASAGPFIRRRDAIAYAGLSASTFDALVNAKILPPPRKVTPRLTLFSKPALDLALASRGDSNVVDI